MNHISTFNWARIYQLAVVTIFALSPGGAVAYLYITANPTVYVWHTFHELAITVAVVISLFLAHLSYRCHRQGGEALTRYIALGFFSFAVLYAPHGAFTPQAADCPALFLLWGPVSRFYMSSFVLYGILVRHDQARPWWPALALIGLGWVATLWVTLAHPEWFQVLRLWIEILAGIFSLTALTVLLLRRMNGLVINYLAIALVWFALSSLAFVLGKPWNAQWWLAHAISAAGFLLLGLSVAIVFRTSQAFKAGYDPEAMFSLLLNAERITQELRKSKDEAEQSAQSKSSFLAAASHDLRQPAQAIMLYLDALRYQLGADHPAARVVNHLDKAATALQDILEGLLDVSRLDAGIVEVRADTIPLAAFLSEIAAQARLGMERGKTVDITVEAPPLWVRTDPRLLRRLITNLVDNAVKYTPKGHVLIDCHPQDGMIRIQVTDDGPGIPSDQHQAIFEEFVQLTNPERDRSKGLGLGLAIVRRLAVLLGGKVGLTSIVGQGSTFWVDLPPAPPGETLDPQPSHPSVSA